MFINAKNKYICFIKLDSMTQQEIDQYRKDLKIFKELLENTTDANQRLIIERAQMRTLSVFYEKLKAYERNSN